MVKYKLKTNEQGQVGYYLLSGNCFTHDLMNAAEARSIIENGKLELSDKKKGFPLCVDGKYFIEAEIREVE